MILSLVLVYALGVFGFLIAGFLNYRFWKDFDDEEDRDRAKFFLGGALIWPVALLQRLHQAIWDLYND